MSELSPAVEGVLQRWNPEGMDLIRRLRIADADRPAVALFSPGRVDSAPLGQELTTLTPRIDIVRSPMEAVVVVMLLDAAVPVGRAELQAIGELLTTGSQPVYALCGVEAHRDWRTVRDRDVALLSHFAGDAGDLRIWPVSPRLARASRALPANKGSAETVLAGSGLAQLHSMIIEALPDDPESTRLAHVERAGKTVIRLTRRIVAAEAEQLRGEDQRMAGLRTERTTLTGRRDGGRAEAGTALRAQLQLARVELLNDVGVRIRAANTEANLKMDQAERARGAVHSHTATLDRIPARVADLITDVTTQVDQDIWDRLGELSGRVGIPQGTEQAAAVIRTPAPSIGSGPAPRYRGLEDKVMIVLGGSTGVALARLAVWPLSLVPALDYAVWPLALLLGAGATWWLMRSRRHIADRNHMREWVTGTLVNAKAQLEQRVVSALVETETLLVDYMSRAAHDRTVEVDRRIAEISAQIRDTAARRAGKLAACERDLATLD